MKALEENLLKKIEQQIPRGSQALGHDRITYVDFIMYPCLDRIPCLQFDISEASH